jgi:hypothetical protein
MKRHVISSVVALAVVAVAFVAFGQQSEREQRRARQAVTGKISPKRKEPGCEKNYRNQLTSGARSGGKSLK